MGTARPPTTASTVQFFGGAAPTNTPERSLTFVERLAHHRAIEEVYWRHRIWPEDNPTSKPPLDAVISQAQLEKKVQDYLLKSQFIADQRGSPISSRELQAEMERMASHSKRPEVLGELFAALGNDPFVIAECLARPILADRLAAGPGVVVDVPPAPTDHLAADTASFTEDRIDVMANGNKVQYRLPEIVPLDCADDSWSATTIVNAPDAREYHTAVWTGSEMIIWGGFNSSPPYRLNTGARYNPATDSWASTSIVDAPTGRDFHTAVWTGSEMIVWGGEPILNTGAKYNPTTDSWTAISTTNAPTARASQTAVWTGTQMIVWGGRDQVGEFNTGGRYDPSTDSWEATNTINAPTPRWAHSAMWTGSKMVAWGGTDQTSYLHTGGRYDPVMNSWTATSTINVPLGRIDHTAVWTGSEMIVWGGVDSTFNDTNTGGKYNPINDSWLATSLGNAPLARDSHTAVWTGSEMIVWGGYYYPPGDDWNTGGRYNPVSDSWTPTSTINVPMARRSHTAVWTGSEMIVWGGFNVELPEYLNTGGRYCAQSGGPTPTPSPTATSTVTPTPTPTTTVTPTPSSTATSTPSPSATPTGTPRATPRVTPKPRSRPTPHPRP